MKCKLDNINKGSELKKERIECYMLNSTMQEKEKKMMVKKLHRHEAGISQKAEVSNQIKSRNQERKERERPQLLAIVSPITIT
jgi:hypothetical protein